MAFLCNAFTAPAYRQRGVYLSLLAHRLALATRAGCVAAVTVAQAHSSAPILMKRGFRPLFHQFGYCRPAPDPSPS